MKPWMKTLLVWGLLLGIVVIYFASQKPSRQAASYVNSERALEMVRSGQIAHYEYADGWLVLVDQDNRAWSTTEGGGAVVDALAERGTPFQEQARNSGWQSVLWAVAVVLVLVAVVLLFFRRMQGVSAKTIMEMRTSKARKIQESDRARFTDIGGNCEAIALFEDVVSFLKNPKVWADAGARIPRGVLIVGPPGVGKTLLARAVAGEAKATFLYVSASEFVELFVGVGAARMRDTFEQAAKSRPAIVFIDELDAIGRRRGSAVGTMHEEREQTLNQLLVQMDGLERRGQLVVIAATNRPDILDPALLRSGRFDRMLKLAPPTAAERVEILRIHTRNKALAPDVDLEALARRAESFTGADLESWANQAALLAVRSQRRAGENGSAPLAITTADFEQAWQDMTRSNRQFDRLDSVLVESVSQFAEPTGSARVRLAFRDGQNATGMVVWMNASHLKLELPDGSGIVYAKDAVLSLTPLEGTDDVRREDLRPDRWSERRMEIG